ncbi:MAG: hypothetical protein WKF84_23350 [Pyrinomonadaceae bacterium]
MDWGRMNREAGALLKRLGLEIDPRATLGHLNIALRQMVAIARGVSLGAKLSCSMSRPVRSRSAK